MILARYLFRRFFSYVLWSATLLTLLFNFIEFCEKMVRVQQVGIGAIMHFIYLNFIPSFFDIMPLASCIATLFLIKELAQADEWTSLSILAVSQRSLFKIIASAGLLLCLVYSFGREYLALPLMVKAERYKQVTFKQHAHQKIVNQWMALDAATFCSYAAIDIKSLEGSDLFIISMTPSFTITKTLHAQHFFLAPSRRAISIPEATSFDSTTGLSTKSAHTELIIPSFFSHLNIVHEPPYIKKIVRCLVTDKKYLPPAIINELLTSFFKFLTSALLLLIYPLLTLCLFFLGAHDKWPQKLIVFAPYPFLFAITSFTDICVAHGAPAAASLIPAALSVSLIAVLYQALSFNSADLIKSNLKK